MKYEDAEKDLLELEQVMNNKLAKEKLRFTKKAAKKKVQQTEISI